MIIIILLSTVQLREEAAVFKTNSKDLEERNRPPSKVNNNIIMKFNTSMT